MPAEPRREKDGLTHGQAKWLVVKLKRQGRDAFAIRANDDTFVVFSTPAMEPIRV